MRVARERECVKSLGHARANILITGGVAQYLTFTLIEKVARVRSQIITESNWPNGVHQEFFGGRYIKFPSDIVHTVEYANSFQIEWDSTSVECEMNVNCDNAIFETIASACFFFLIFDPDHVDASMHA